MKQDLSFVKRIKGLACILLSLMVFFQASLAVQAAGATYRLSASRHDTGIFVMFSDASNNPIADGTEIAASSM